MMPASVAERRAEVPDLKQKLLFVFGTRPEAIKLAPVVRAAQRDERFVCRVCVTAQHRQMLDQVLELFQIVPDHDLNVMQPNQNLFDLTGRLITSIRPVLELERPQWVLVQGDTTTVWTAALGAFYSEVKVGHVEAGLRTYDKRQPFPEEINRRICSVLTDLHFAPTAAARDNLTREGIAAGDVLVTGNTVIDALLWVVERLRVDPPADVRQLAATCNEKLGDRPMVLITGHRRESFGEGFQQICEAIRDLATRHADWGWCYPVHLNPNVQEPVRRLLGGLNNVHLLDPVPYAQFTWLMQRSSIILTDSGGVQEEAPSLAKPVLVMRNTTERPEGVAAGCARLVGNRRDGIVSAMEETIAAVTSGSLRMPVNPYGDGEASRRILDGLAARGGNGAACTRG